MHAYAKTHTHTHTHTHTSQRAEQREHCRLCTMALLHFRTIDVCLLYEGTRGEKRNSCWCLFELWPNPTWGGCVGAHSAPNPSRSCTPSQPHTHTYCTHSGTERTHNTNFTTPSHTRTHAYLSILAISRCVCLSLPTILGPPRAGISLSFPQTHTYTHTHTDTHTHIHTLQLYRGAVCGPTA